MDKQWAIGVGTGREELTMDNYEKGVAEEEEGREGTAVERAFEWQRVPPLREQLTARALAVSFLLSVMFSVIVMKLNLTTGIIPSLNVAAGLLGFFFVKLWTRALEHAGLLRTPFTRQENTVIQASVTAAYGLAFSAVALILGDGLYNFVKVVRRTSSSFISAVLKGLPISDDEPAPKNLAISFDDERRTEVFVRDHIPPWAVYGCYVVIATLSIVTLPRIFPPLKWYHILVVHVFAPLLAFCNAYGCGLTDWNTASTYGKLAIFVFGAWAGAHHGGVIAGLAACGVMMSVVATASDLMQNFRTGYLTLASPRSMFASQVIGTAMGCVIAPCVFWLFYKAFDDIGKPGTQYPAPYALIYRNMAILRWMASRHFQNTASLSSTRSSRSLSPSTWRRMFIPIPMAMAIPFYIGASFAIDMCVGSVILYVWTKMNKGKASAFGPAVASGLICGDGMWGVPQGVLALAQSIAHTTARGNGMENGVEGRPAMENPKKEEEEGKGGEAVSVERTFEGQRVPPWREQLTARALAVSFLLSVMLSVIVMKLNLTTGIIPSLNVAAGLLGFFFVKLWTKALEHVGLLRTPFTRQENTVIQTAVVAAYGLAFSGGFGSYLFGMSSKIADQTTEANDSRNIKDPKLGWMIGFMFVVSFLGLFSLVPLRKIMIIDYKLIYPSGTATAYLINGFHTPRGEKLAKCGRWASSSSTASCGDSSSGSTRLVMTADSKLSLPSASKLMRTGFTSISLLLMLELE
ncbi:OPT oligopeptide transporter protein [Musa troglodytarum]|uniref:OPT oligopeptide transporter protein n=1 Tax=Musa troglodytarum TaxID=320322 RepID=A0A9E7EIX4_9LILI|nr:OPT oligopeptide transporter protein [Musa troglodytarum]URD78214.1 OPT oligopeptide transporter protein [Musa troglodytarum]